MGFLYTFCTLVLIVVFPTNLIVKVYEWYFHFMQMRHTSSLKSRACNKCSTARLVNTDTRCAWKVERSQHQHFYSAQCDDFEFFNFLQKSGRKNVQHRLRVASQWALSTWLICTVYSILYSLCTLTTHTCVLVHKQMHSSLSRTVDKYCVSAAQPQPTVDECVSLSIERVEYLIFT